MLYMAKKSYNFRFDPELIHRVDEDRHDVSRTRWVERAIEHWLMKDAVWDDGDGPPKRFQSKVRFEDAEKASEEPEKPSLPEADQPAAMPACPICGDYLDPDVPHTCPKAPKPKPSTGFTSPAHMAAQRRK